MSRLIIAAWVSLLLAGCLKTRADIDAEQTGQAQERQTLNQQQQKPYKEKAPATAYRFEEYDDQMRALNGRIEALENAVNQLKAAKQSEKESSVKDKQSYDREFQAFEEAIKKLEAQVTALTDDIAKLKAPPPEAVEKPAAATKGGKSPYDSAQDQFTGKKWKEAIVNFQKYRDQNPKGKMYSDATYKIGVCFQELGMKDEAKSFLEEVTSKYPNSKEAKKAAFRLKSLK